MIPWHKLPIPDDWNEQDDGYVLLMACIPDSKLWRGLYLGRLYELTRGRKWDESTGRVVDAQAIAKAVHEGVMVCKLDDMVFELQRLNAILAGEKISTTVDGQEVILADYRETGIRPTLREIGVAPVSWQDDLGSVLTGEIPLASLIKSGLIGRRIDLTPLPGEGSGLADILDEQGAAANDSLDSLHNRFRQFDLSLDGTPFEKNITETLETLFRLRGITDPEFMPNLTNVLYESLNVSGEVADTFKNTILNLITNQLGLLPSHKTWLQNLITDKDAISVVDALLMMLSALQKLDSSTSKIDARTVINLNNGLMCNQNGAGQTETETSTVTITDEGVTVEGLLESGN